MRMGSSAKVLTNSYILRVPQGSVLRPIIFKIVINEMDKGWRMRGLNEPSVNLQTTPSQLAALI